MSRRPLRIATTGPFERSVRVAGFDTYLLPKEVDLDIHRPIAKRLADGAIYRPFLEKHDIELVLDFNAGALTLVHEEGDSKKTQLTTAALGIPYVACYLDPITSTMGQVNWRDHWHLLESKSWIKGIPDAAHAEELVKLGVPNVVPMPMAAEDAEISTDPLPDPDPGPVITFIGHPASTWFHSQQEIRSGGLLPGLTAAAVHADMPDLPFHSIYYDLYEFGEPPGDSDDQQTRARIAGTYFNDKFVFNAYLAVKQRDRFARFLRQKLGDAFELVGDNWGSVYGLEHKPRIWDRKIMYDRMRRVPICLNLIKGNMETGLILRHFEITAYGGFMLTYPTAELPNFFEIGKECDIFRSEAELLDKIEYYLDHDKERREIAAEGQRRTLAEHMYSHRVTSLVELLRSNGVLPALSEDRSEVTAANEQTEPARESTVVDSACPTVQVDDAVNDPPAVLTRIKVAPLPEEQLFKAQFGEDRILWQVFRQRTDGYFIEVGAFDGVALSNTYFLERMGWRGVLVEPILPLCQQAAAARLRSRVIHAAAGPAGSCGTTKFTLTQNVPVLSFLRADQEHVERCRREGAVLVEIEVPLTSLDDIILNERRDPGPSGGPWSSNMGWSIDLISIDVEGTELDVLDGLDLDRFRPRILLIENDRASGAQIEPYLDSRGYRKFHRQEINDFYVRSDDPAEDLQLSDLRILKERADPVGLHLPPTARGAMTSA